VTPVDRHRRRLGRRADTRRAEALVAAGRVIAERGAEATRFSDVSEASGIPVSTLQYYFGSREDLLAAAFRHASATEIAGLRQELDALSDPWEAIGLIVERAIEGYRPPAVEIGQLWVEAWCFARRDDEMRADVLKDYEAWRRLISGQIELGVAAGRFRPLASTDAAAGLVLALIDGIGMPLALGDPGIAAGAQTLLAAVAALLNPTN
jgi:AcrR family transcriptional regulator